MIDWKDTLPSQYRDATKMHSVLEGFSSSVSEAEEAMDELRGLMDTSLAEGVQLDRIGAWKGMARGASESDASYRTRLTASTIPLPTMPAMRAAIKNIIGEESVGLYPDWPAGIYIVVEEPTFALKQARNDLSAAGVDAQLGTFLGDEDDLGYIIDEDTEMPIVVDI